MLLCFAFIGLATLLAAGQPGEVGNLPPLMLGLEPGPYAVGFKVLFLSDDSREFEYPDGVAAGRPIRVMLWYPAAPSKLDGMPFSGYFGLKPGNDRFDPYAALLDQRDHETATRQFSPADEKDLYGKLMQTPTLARRDLPRARGRFPLLVHSLGRNDYQQESTVLWEYLASHGYVVANVPQFGSSLEEHQLGFNAESLQLQAADIQFALSALARTEGVDGTRIGLMGHSSGALVTLLVASRDSSIDAIVSLEGSLSTGEGASLIRAMSWDPQTIGVPLLNLYAAGKKDLDLGLLDGLSRAPVTHAAIGTGAPPRQATHFDFQNWPLFSPLVGVEDPRGTWFRDPEAGREFFLEVCRSTLRFLDLHLATAGPDPDRLPPDRAE